MVDLDVSIYKRLRDFRQVGSQAIVVERDDLDRDELFDLGHVRAAVAELERGGHAEDATLGEEHRGWTLAAGVASARGSTVGECLSARRKRSSRRGLPVGLPFTCFGLEQAERPPPPRTPAARPSRPSHSTNTGSPP